MAASKKSLWDAKIVRQALIDSVVKLSPRTMMRNPVMFVVEVGSVITSVLLIKDISQHNPGFSFDLQITLWLWFTVLFANFAEAMAEGRGKAQADTLRKARAETQAHLLTCDNKMETVPSSKLRSGDIVVVRAGDFIPGDGEVIEGVASVDESAITGESAPVIRESGGDRSAVTGGARVLSDEIKVRITSNPGETFLDRMIQRHVIAMSGRAVEASGAVDVVLLGKTATITLGNRAGTQFLPASGIEERHLADAAQLSSLADETPEGRSIVVLAKERYNLRGRDLSSRAASFVPFSAQTRMSGVDLDGRQVRKGALEAITRLCENRGHAIPVELQVCVREISNGGGTPLLVAENGRVLGAIALTDIVKGGMKERFDHLRAMGIRTMMITGDNPLTAAAIARQAGVDDFLAEATPEDKMALIKREQSKGKLVAMTGDGTNDAPALAQADVGVAMNTGTQAAKEAGNMVDLDSNPTKLIEIVEIGKQLLMTRGALTTFSIANDVAKYFAMLPAMFSVAFPALNKLNILHLHSPQSAITSAIIFNALIIIALIPLALRGVRYRPASAQSLLRRNLWIYGAGGLIIPFIGIKIIDLIIMNIPGFSG